jgi:ATP-dependent Clp protease ATP-binding subunit ClpX
MRRRRPLHCSFCRKHEDAVEKLIGGPGVTICDACVAICNRILAGTPAPAFPGWWRSLSDDALLALLKPSSAVADATREALQEHVDELRRREVSWSRIGEALDVSRQAAWERFS